MFSRERFLKCYRAVPKFSLFVSYLLIRGSLALLANSTVYGFGKVVTVLKSFWYYILLFSIFMCFLVSYLPVIIISLMCGFTKGENNNSVKN